MARLREFRSTLSYKIGHAHGRYVLAACFIGTVVVAMAGWLWAIGWVVLER
jgi:hypothetical protein